MKKFLFLSILLSFGCTKKMTIEEGDIVIKCVIKEREIMEPNSTIEPGYRYKYYTDCGEELTTNYPHIYKIGDTITFVYKKKK